MNTGSYDSGQINWNNMGNTSAPQPGGQFSGSTGDGSVWGPGPTHRRSSTFETIWTTNSNHSSISSAGGVPHSPQDLDVFGFAPMANVASGINTNVMNHNPTMIHQNALNQSPSIHQIPGDNPMNPPVGYGINLHPRSMGSMSGATMSPQIGSGPFGGGFVNHRSSIGSSDSHPGDYSWDHRRHSQGDVPLGSPKNTNASIDLKTTANTPGDHAASSPASNDPAQLVNEYFDADPHRRVTVTLHRLQEQYYGDTPTPNVSLPRFPSEPSLRNSQLVLVAFKAGRLDVFTLPGPSSHPELGQVRPGDLVIVEADRGRDLGRLVQLDVSIDEARWLKYLQFQEQQHALTDEEANRRGSGHSEDHDHSQPVLHLPKAVVSFASQTEVLRVLNKQQDEEKACRLCVAKISSLTLGAHGEGLANMQLIDAEYQFDRNKLIFYYATNRRIDFRDLVRELFRIYKTRIWMCAVVGIPFSRRSSMVTPIHFNSPFPTSVPRNFSDNNSTNEETDTGESFVLKSLVDQINH
ncbi:hypothetical protein PSN45_002722 [Yamadazyma tenuis]|uniref:PSP1-domain-containing protein n=1 Tax=Candida tenuis (strain ATCC 10573 / BCRC 21748 / CBS 615 / JCM 9827 / NBRC 10315 / NRRL Y-1498 / VKM Y-70) TaxID=590646 RepID=G3AX14_CANTC|nr:PSP1-domain-containing protein [Yamadazyma tenuis ATCC 10573]EGV66663.1 PSP1-domain-containing protein [Yamadazyma tenuis ATCC 10573]WEJ95209.1 hypothetical protein PSN45_002722 [Yamadazyma tenuis]